MKVLRCGPTTGSPFSWFTTTSTRTTLASVFMVGSGCSLSEIAEFAFGVLLSPSVLFKCFAITFDGGFESYPRSHSFRGLRTPCAVCKSQAGNLLRDLLYFLRGDPEHLCGPYFWGTDNSSAKSSTPEAGPASCCGRQPTEHLLYFAGLIPVKDAIS